MSLLIDCHSCSVRNIACGDCFVMALIGTSGETGATAHLDDVEVAAVRNLSQLGLVPEVQYQAGENVAEYHESYVHSPQSQTASGARQAHAREQWSESGRGWHDAAQGA